MLLILDWYGVSRSHQDYHGIVSKNKNSSLMNGIIMKTKYTTEFNLTNPIDDGALRTANEYLQSDDMTQFIDEDLKPIVQSIKWVLDDEESGRVIVLANRELTTGESSRLSRWISGQCSDGLGEGFEQQPFATHESEDESEDEYYDDYEESSFDWETNDYRLHPSIIA